MSDAHDALISLRADATPETLSQLAEGFGPEPQPILDEMGSSEVAQVIEENRALARRMQISGTPTFVVGDELLRGDLWLAQMHGVADEVRGSNGG